MSLHDAAWDMLHAVEAADAAGELADNIGGELIDALRAELDTPPEAHAEAGETLPQGGYGFLPGIGEIDSIEPVGYGDAEEQADGIKPYDYDPPKFTRPASAGTEGLQEALIFARGVIMGWNGMGHEGEELEMVTRAYEHSPEIKRIDAAIAAAEGEHPMMREKLEALCKELEETGTGDSDRGKGYYLACEHVASKLRAILAAAPEPSAAIPEGLRELVRQWQDHPPGATIRCTEAAVLLEQALAARPVEAKAEAGEPIAREGLREYWSIIENVIKAIPQFPQLLA